MRPFPMGVATLSDQVDRHRISDLSAESRLASLVLDSAERSLLHEAGDLAMTALHDTGDLTCPRCGASLAEAKSKLAAEVREPNGQIRIDEECPSCDAPLAVIVASAAPEAIGVNVWVEDRRELDES